MDRCWRFALDNKRASRQMPVAETVSRSVLPTRRAFDAAVVRDHGAPDCGAATAYGIGTTQAGEHFGRTKGSGKETCYTSRENGPIPNFRFPGKRVGTAVGGCPEVVGMKKSDKNCQQRNRWEYTGPIREARMASKLWSYHDDRSLRADYAVFPIPLGEAT